MLRSIQWRVTIWFVLVIVVSMAALGAYLTISVRERQTADLRLQLENEARLAGVAALPGLEEPGRATTLDGLAKRLGAETGARITIIARDGTVLGDSTEDPATMENHANRPEVIDALAEGRGESSRYSTTLGKKMLYVAVSIKDNGQVLGVARAALPLSTVDGYVNHLIIVMAVALAATAIVAILAAWLAARVTTRPIRDLTRASRQLASGDFNYRITPGSGDEAGQLARAFNDMARRLQEMVTTISADRNRLTTVLENMADGIIMTDREGNVVLSNRSAERLLGFRPEGAPRPLIEVARDYELNEILKRCLDTGKAQEVQFETSAGGRFLRAIAINIGGKGAGALVLLQDLTELRALQTMRRELIGNISHDFRTPLAVIKAMVETLESGALKDPEVATDFLARIEAEVDRLTQMVAELTELSRIETGRAGMRKGPVDVNGLVREVFSELSPQAERQRISLETRLTDGLPAITADRERLRQVIVNLVHNAIKFNRPGGSVTGLTGTTGTSVTVEITDTGIGISPENLPRIFERFYKADGSRSGQGSGMGLAIARHIIEAHGGTIRAGSEEGRGSTFSFSLPLK